MILTLNRDYRADCTPGELVVAGRQFATIERPWIVNPAGLGGMPAKSCVPEGSYALFPHHSARYPDVYALENHDLGVYYQQLPAGQSWGRTAILIHIGNFARDVIGCIAIGMRQGTLNGETAVLQSGVALDQLRTLLGRAQHRLVIGHPST